MRQPTTPTRRSRWRRLTHVALLTAALVAPAVPASASTGGSSGGDLGWLFDAGQTSMLEVGAATGASGLWAEGRTGTGVGVALLDTGVVPVAGVDPARVANGPDLSFESQLEQARNLDTYGHGTHMAGIIAGTPDSLLSGTGFTGMAPGARLVSLKLASYDGAVDVSQVVAGIDWVVAHKDDPGMNIRVLNLSYGTDGVQDYKIDPLVHAVENAWRAGIVVVVSAGNSSFGTSRLNNPAYAPFAITVGSTDTMGTPWTLDDTVPDWSGRGDSTRGVDIVAPGRSLLSLRNPGSYVDEGNPGARVGTRFFKGSGTSQSAAVVSGAVALLLEQRPSLTPDQVKALLTSTAAPLPLADAAGQGAGALDIYQAAKAATPSVEAATTPLTSGLGKLDAARGTQRVADNGVVLTGEKTVWGSWSSSKWAKASDARTAWSGGSWMGTALTGTCWCASSWAGTTWSGRTWSGNTWSGRTWAGVTWSGRTWSGSTWSGNTWSGRTWAGSTWSGRTWT